MFFLIANMMPMLGIRAVGAESYTTVFRGTELLWEHGQKIVAIMVFIAAILAPGLQILFMLLLLLGAWQESPPLWVGTLLRRIPMIQVWSMIEVMLLGVMVSLTKIAEYAAVLPGHALFALGALLVVLTAMQSTFDAREVWGRVQWVHGKEIPIGSRLTEEAR